MAIFRGLQTLSAIEAGALNSAALDTLLADPGRYAEWQMVGTIQGQVDRMWASDLTIDTILGSGRALRALASVRGKAFYGAEYLKFMAPSAWGVYLPDSALMTTTVSSGVANWLNALGDPSKDMVQATASAQPLADYVNSPIFGQPVVNFVSSDVVAATTWPGTTGFSYTIFVVYRRTDSTASGYISGGTNPGFGNSAAGAAVSYNTALGTFNNNVGAVGSWAMSRFRRNGTLSLYHSLNGGAESAAIATANQIPEFTGAMAIGRGTTAFMTGQIAEVWIVSGNADQTSTEIQRITAMLKNKYGL